MAQKASKYYHRAEQLRSTPSECNEGVRVWVQLLRAARRFRKFDCIDSWGLDEIVNLSFVLYQKAGLKSSKPLNSVIRWNVIMRVVLFALLLTGALSVNAQNFYSSINRVDNFQLIDHTGKAHELFYYGNYGNKKAIVLMVHGNGCPIVRNLVTDYQQVVEEYKDRGVTFFFLNSNLQDKRATIAKEASEFGITVPILDDESQLVGESLNLERTAEVLVIDPKTWETKYRGPINDRLHYERQQQTAKNHYLKNSLDAVLSGKAIKVAKRQAKGCIINFPERQRRQQHASISYSKTIAPLLQDKCVDCHREGGIGPWAMNSYEMVQGFAPMIREVVRTKRMPPWHADPHINSFSNDRGLSNEQAQTLVHWIEAGAPRGDGKDPLVEAGFKKYEEWPLGKPDLVLTMPKFDVPATGVLEYQHPYVKNPLDRDVWVRAVTILPGNREVVHHLLAGSVEYEPKKGGANDEVFKNYLVGYVPGGRSAIYPEKSGVFVPKGGYFVFQIHYTTSGRATSDQSKMALYFHKRKPKYVLRNHVILDPTIRIPAHAAEYSDQAYMDFEHDAIVYSLFPHAHYRGKSAFFDLISPEGQRERVLSVPKYDFNWQRDYELAKPLQVKAGSILVYGSTYDNSANNPGNPDPSKVVIWGLQSADEMLYGSVRFRWQDERSSKLIHDARRQYILRMFGYMDRNMNRRIERDEMSSLMKQQLDDRFAELDGDSNGGLDIEEYMGSFKKQVSSNQ